MFVQLSYFCSFAGFAVCVYIWKQLREIVFLIEQGHPVLAAGAEMQTCVFIKKEKCAIMVVTCAHRELLI